MTRAQSVEKGKNEAFYNTAIIVLQNYSYINGKM